MPGTGKGAASSGFVSSSSSLSRLALAQQALTKLTMMRFACSETMPPRM